MDHSKVKMITIIISSVILIGILSVLFAPNWGLIDLLGEKDEKFRLKVEIKDAFLTDRITYQHGVKGSTSQFAVLWLNITNDGSKKTRLIECGIGLETGTGSVESESSHGLIPKEMDLFKELEPDETIEGWIFYNIYPNEVPIGLSIGANSPNVKTIDLDLSGQELPFRPWKTPLEIEINGCARDGSDEQHPGTFYMSITISCTGMNSTHPDVWHMTMNMTNGDIRDAMMGNPSEEAVFNFGQEGTFKIYFDVPAGSTEKPEVLASEIDGIYLDIDPVMFEDLFDEESR